MNTSKVQRWRAAAIRPLFAAMDELCINRSQLARKYGITRSMLYQYEKGQLQMPSHLINGLVDHLQLPLDKITPEMWELIDKAPNRLARGSADHATHQPKGEIHQRGETSQVHATGTNGGDAYRAMGEAVQHG